MQSNPAMFHRLLRSVVLCTGLVLSLDAAAQPRPMDEGKQYEVISQPLPTDTPEDVIEVLDVFWYGCPVCQEFEPMMTYWGEQVRGDLAMRRMPAIWNPVMKLHAQVYYTAVQLEVIDRAHPAAFRYIHENKQPLNTIEQARAFFAELGVANDAFEQAWNAEPVLAALVQAEQKTAAASVKRLPALVVNGRYRVVRNEGVPELPEVVITANQLVKLLREERRID
jgi:thiol:disulfide interchange protein DsbA